jgi:hypothetical protein
VVIQAAGLIPLTEPSASRMLIHTHTYTHTNTLTHSRRMPTQRCSRAQRRSSSARPRGAATACSRRRRQPKQTPSLLLCSCDESAGTETGKYDGTHAYVITLTRKHTCGDTQTHRLTGRQTHALTHVHSGVVFGMECVRTSRGEVAGRQQSRRREGGWRTSFLDP